MRDVFNFSAGPSMLPEEVLLSVQKDFANYNGSGMCVAEMSHRCKWYDEIHEEALALIKELMNVSDLMVCRSGAMTITEISIVGKPAIFIPLPSMSANRQEDNALVLKKIGAAKMILNNEVNGTNLAEEIDDIIHDKLELEEMGKMAHTIAPYNVEEKIYEEIEKILKK